MLELVLRLTSEQALAECQRRGLVVVSERELAGRRGSRHWHLRLPGKAGTLELNEWQGEVWVKVHPLRDGGWAAELARELAQLSPVEQRVDEVGADRPRSSRPAMRANGLEVAAGRRHARVERSEVQVMFKRANDEQPAITRAWAELEKAVGSLRGRKFYGVFDPINREYRACVELSDADDPDGLGLELGVLPGGRYVRERLHGEPPSVYALIAPAFKRLAKRPDCDRTRPSIEFYRRRDAIDLLQPVV